MSSKDPRPASPPNLDSPELQELCKADQERLIDALVALRAQVATGRFGEIDRQLGLKPGWLGRVFRGEKTLSHPRLLRLIRILGEEPGRFFARVFPNGYDRPAPIGLLPRLIQRPARIQPPAWRDRLLEWGQSVTITDRGQSFDHDPEDLLKLRQEDFDAAERVGIAAIEYHVGLSEGSLARGSAVPFTTWLTILATILKSCGDRFSAADLFDLAFRIEGQIGDDRNQSFILRNASYLLSDWGYLEEAEEFSRLAIDLATLAGDRQGIALSSYAFATVRLYSGDEDLALKGYESCLALIDGGQAEVIAGASQAIALLHLEQHNTKEAALSIKRMNRIKAALLSLPSKARRELVLAELESQLGNVARAQSLFDNSLELFLRCRGAAEAIMASLFLIRHYIRHRRLSFVRPTAEALLDLAHDPSLDKTSRAMLLEITRLCYRGELTALAVTRAIDSWRQIMPRLSLRQNPT